MPLFSQISQLNMYKFTEKFFLLILLLAGWIAIYPQEKHSEPIERTLHVLRGINLPDPEDIGGRIAAHVRYLADDLFGGRGTGELGGYLSAKYLGRQFSEIGLIPVGEDNSFYQTIRFHGSRMLPESNLTFSLQGREKQCRLNEDYVPVYVSSHTYLPHSSEMVFAGYGITAPEYDYDDYHAIQVQGKVVVVLDGEPYSKDKNFFDGENPTQYREPLLKLKTAIANGAAGLFIVPMDLEAASYWKKLVEKSSFEQLRLAYGPTSRLCLFLKPDVARDIFKNERMPLEDAVQAHFDNRITSFPLQSTVTLRGVFSERDFLSQNVIGMLPGTDPQLKDSYILVTAHYDHLGIGPAVNGDSIYNGLMDNALGVSLVVELARVMSESQFRPKRSVLFLLLTGEEAGMFGSQHYIENPLFPLYKSIAAINVDGVSAFDEVDAFTLLGDEYSELLEYSKAAARHLGLERAPLEGEFSAQQSFLRSDQAMFAIGGIPSAILLESFSYRNHTRDEGRKAYLDYMENRYHSPADDLTQPVNYLASAQHLKILYTIVNLIADSDKEIEWDSGVPYKNARLTSKAEKR